MKLKFTLFIFLCLCGGGWFFYNQNKTEIQELVKAGQELNQLAEKNQIEKQKLLQELQSEMQGEVDPSKIEIKKIQAGAETGKQIESIDQEFTIPFQEREKERGPTKMCAREKLKKVEDFLKTLQGQFMYRTEISPCGEIVGRSTELKSIQAIIEFVQKEEPQIKVNLGQQD